MKEETENQRYLTPGPLSHGQLVDCGSQCAITLAFSPYPSSTKLHMWVSTFSSQGTVFLRWKGEDAMADFQVFELSLK